MLCCKILSYVCRFCPADRLCLVAGLSQLCWHTVALLLPVNVIAEVVGAALLQAMPAVAFDYSYDCSYSSPMTSDILSSSQMLTFVTAAVPCSFRFFICLSQYTLPPSWLLHRSDMCGSQHFESASDLRCVSATIWHLGSTV